MNSEQLELVSAYVDGQATAEERAQVEADAELMAEVDRQRSLRTALHDVDAPSGENRETAIAAALAVFDEEHAPTSQRPGVDQGSDVTAPTNIVPLEQRRRLRMMQGLGAAAAALVIVVAGAVIATRERGDDGTTADEQQAFPATSLDRESSSPPEAAATVVPTTISAQIMAAEAPATEALESADAATVDTTESYEGEDEPAEPPAAPSGAAPTSAPPPLVVISTADELASLAGEIKVDVPAVDESAEACDDRLLKADAMFEDAEGVQHPIIVVLVDDDTLGALSLEDCEIVLQAER